MPTITSQGTVEQTNADTIVARGKAAARQLWGSTVNTRGTGSTQKLLEAFVLSGVGQFEQVFQDLYKSRYIRYATGQALDDAVWPFFLRLQPDRSVGDITLTLTSGLTTPSPLFAAGTVTFLDSTGVRYDLIEDVLPNGTTTVTAHVRCQQLGSIGNVGIDDIVDKAINDPTTLAFFNANVASYSNLAAFSGGRDLETDAEFRRRIRDAPTAREGASVPGLELALGPSKLAGSTGARVLENNNPNLIGGTEDDMSTQSGTGTDSETIGGTNTRIAVKVPVLERRFIQHFAARFHNLSGTPTFTVRLETDSSGSPSGTLASSVFSKAAFTPTNNTLTTGIWDNGDYVAPGVYWLVFTATAGTAALDGAVRANATIANPGFETYTTSPGAPDSWTSLGGTGVTFTKETVVVQAGSNAVKITSGGGTAQGLRGDISGAVAGTVYRIGAMARTSGAAGEVPVLQVWDKANDRLVAQAEGVAASTAYTELVAHFTAKSQITYEVRLLHKELSTAGRIVYFDSLTVSDQSVKYYNGSAWATSALIDSPNTSVLGGVPPRAFRAYVGGTASPNSIAAAIRANRAAGIKSDGTASGTVGAYTENYEVPIQVPVVIRVAVQVTDSFDGDEDTLRDLIVDYVDALGSGDTLVRAELYEQLLNDDNVVGVFDVTTLLLDRKAAVTNGDPANLDSSDVNNIVTQIYEEAAIVDAAADISVTIQQV